MALFSSKSKEPKAKAAPKKAAGPRVKKEKKARVPKASSEKKLADSRLENMVTAPWLSEKALIGTEKGVYVFSIPLFATKLQVKQAVERIYKVVPRAVNVVNVRGKSKQLRSRRGYGVRSKRRKAYVYLKAGDSIQF
mgnify:CR=1 FL=1